MPRLSSIFSILHNMLWPEEDKPSPIQSAHAERQIEASLRIVADSAVTLENALLTLKKMNPGPFMDMKSIDATIGVLKGIKKDFRKADISVDIHLEKLTERQLVQFVKELSGRRLIQDFDDSVYCFRVTPQSLTRTGENYFMAKVHCLPPPRTIH